MSWSSIDKQPRHCIAEGMVQAEQLSLSRKILIKQRDLTHARRLQSRDLRCLQVWLQDSKWFLLQSQTRKS